MPFPADEKIKQNEKGRHLAAKNSFLASKLAYYEGGFEVSTRTVAQLRSDTPRTLDFLQAFRSTVLGSHKIRAPLPFIVGQKYGRDRAFGIGLRDIIEGSAYCLSLVWKERKHGRDAVEHELKVASKRPNMAVYLTMLRMVPFRIQDSEFADSDINSFETLIILGELSLMLDFYMLNISPELILALFQGDPRTVSFIEENDSNPAYYFMLLLNSLRRQWRQTNPPITPTEVIAFCDRILGSIRPGLSFQELLEKADMARQVIFDGVWKGLRFLPEIQDLISTRIARTFNLRRTLKFPILGLNLLDNEQLAICYKTNPIPYLIGCYMYDDPLPATGPLPDEHLLGALSELHTMTTGFISGSS